jgi:hypothetical protein
VSNARLDLPEPDSPVITTSACFGNVEIDVLQVVRARAAHADPGARACGRAQGLRQGAGRPAVVALAPAVAARDGWPALGGG